MDWLTMDVKETRFDELRLLRIRQVLDVVPLSKASLYRMIQAKKFPSPRSLGGCAVWDYQEIKRWKEDFVSGSEGDLI